MHFDKAVANFKLMNLANERNEGAAADTCNRASQASRTPKNIYFSMRLAC